VNPWIPVIVTAVLAVLTVTANAIISTTIKFAPDSATVRAELKQIGTTVLRRLLDLAMVLSLVYAVVAPGPITGFRVFNIAIGVSALTFAYTASMIMRVLNGFEPLWKAVNQMGELQAEMSEIQRKVVDHLYDEQSRHIALTGKVVDSQAALVEKVESRVKEET
jgi:hypothetical protein